MTPAEVRAARRQLGLTQAGLGALLGVGVRAVQWWEQDGAPERQRIPAASALALRYMARYGLPEAALMCPRPPSRSPSPGF